MPTVSYCRPCWNKRVAAYRQKNIERRRELDRASKAERMKDPVEYAKHQARCKANYAHPVAQQCEIDGCQEIGERHHDDYSKATEIRWLCRQHHKELHHDG